MRRPIAIPASHLDALHLVCKRLDGVDIIWALTGSLAFALRGMDIPVHDIDLQSDRAGAYEIEGRLIEFVIQPVRFSEAERIRSHFGALEVGGVRVEIMGDVEKRGVDGGWHGPVDLTHVREWIRSDDVCAPVLTLEHEVRAYQELGRPERAKMLARWMNKP